mgnify:CR=1 FL=1
MAVKHEVSKTLPDRRALRDAKRREFLADHGLDLCNDPFAIALGAEEAFTNICKCLDLARSLHEGESSAIEGLSAEIQTLFPGLGCGAVASLDRPTLASVDPDRLYHHFFLTRLW